jgi:hypothetical protein
MKDRFLKFAHQKPVLFLLIAALSVRLLAVIFSKGYMAHDDHFCVLEPAARLVREGSFDFIEDSHHRSFFYPGLNYFLIKLFHSFKIHSPQTIMFFNRLVHALFSLLTVVVGYEFTRRLTDKNTGLLAGLVLCFHFLMPFISVRQLIESVSSVFLLTGLFTAYIFLKKGNYVFLFLAGLILGAAFMVRFQTGVCAAALFCVLVFRKNFRAALALAAGILPALLFEGFMDLAVIGKFFAAPLNYISYNLTHSGSFVTGPWYNYFLLVLAVFVPPFSLFFFWGMIKSFKSTPVLFVPAAAFFILHSVFPGKQERFLIPILPLLVIMGFTGLYLWKKEQDSGYLKEKVLGKSFVFFWAVNTVLLVPVTFNYSQKARIEPLLYINSKQADAVIFDMTEQKSGIPVFYLDPGPALFKSEDPDAFREIYKKLKAQKSRKPFVYYAVIFSSGKVDEHIEMLEKYFKGFTLKKEKHVTPSLIDFVLHKMNPRFNKAKESWVFRLVPTVV